MIGSDELLVLTQQAQASQDEGGTFPWPSPVSPVAGPEPGTVRQRRKYGQGDEARKRKQRDSLPENAHLAGYTRKDAPQAAELAKMIGPFDVRWLRKLAKAVGDLSNDRCPRDIARTERFLVDWLVKHKVFIESALERVGPRPVPPQGVLPPPVVPAPTPAAEEWTLLSSTGDEFHQEDSGFGGEVGDCFLGP
jgi:hypothetical protein